ncbi:hypothetical protein DRE45_21515 [Salmonella enterica subsp. enterica]|nr:hypothetical protein [Salmonella enterica]EBI9831051.1 hypothetical protein [Salmonella enterica]ECE0302379.1 hypothetical protein [Salmonella enterica subsp. enterica serovar Javiana]ECH8744129.1 hypothetical protein [Salmonella enterica subsp. enterica serovar Javiana]MLQ70485.1 hypothetical protein [Salmonella enterica subsp. enterica serovar Javiana]
MCEKEPQLKIAQQLALEFYQILKTKNKLQLNRWFNRTSASSRRDRNRYGGNMSVAGVMVLLRGM